MSYHPIIWDGLKKINAEGPTSTVYELIRSGIAVFSIHTALDAVEGGVNDGLAEIVGIKTANQSAITSAPRRRQLQTGGLCPRRIGSKSRQRRFCRRRRPHRQLQPLRLFLPGPGKFPAARRGKTRHRQKGHARKSPRIAIRDNRARRQTRQGHNRYAKRPSLRSARLRHFQTCRRAKSSA